MYIVCGLEWQYSHKTALHNEEKEKKEKERMSPEKDPVLVSQYYVAAVIAVPTFGEICTGTTQ